MIRKISFWMILAFGILTSSVLGAAADSARFEKIQEEMEIMADIMKRAVKKDDDCERCSVSIRSHYLADQGAVFHINASGRHRSFSFSGDRDFEHIVLPDLPDVAIPAIAPHVQLIEGEVADILIQVDDALAEANIEIEDLRAGDDTSWSWNWTDDSDHQRTLISGQNKEMRKLGRERSRLRRELSELSREMRRAEAEEKELDKIKREHQNLQKEYETANEQYQALSEEHKKQIKIIKIKRDEKRKARSEETRKKNESIQTQVLHALCEYQATLKNVPGNEHISLLFENMAEKNRANVLVFKKSSLARCTPEKDKVAEKALRYMI